MAVPVSFLALLALPSPQAAAQQQAPQPPEEVLFEQVFELPSDRVNAKVRRVTLPADFKTPEHTHAGPGPRYALRATWRSSKVRRRTPTVRGRCSGSRAYR